MTRSLPLKALPFILLLVITGIFGLYQMRHLIRGPTLVVAAPTNGETVAESLVVVTGVASRINRLTLDDRPISTDSTGHFAEPLLVSYGYNIIKLEASDRFGRHVVKILEIVLH